MEGEESLSKTKTWRKKSCIDSPTLKQSEIVLCVARRPSILRQQVSGDATDRGIGIVCHWELSRFHWKVFVHCSQVWFLKMMVHQVCMLARSVLTWLSTPTASVLDPMIVRNNEVTHIYHTYLLKSFDTQSKYQKGKVPFLLSPLRTGRGITNRYCGTLLRNVIEGRCSSSTGKVCYSGIWKTVFDLIDLSVTLFISWSYTAHWVRIRQWARWTYHIIRVSSHAVAGLCSFMWMKRVLPRRLWISSTNLNMVSCSWMASRIKICWVDLLVRLAFTMNI